MAGDTNGESVLARVVKILDAFDSDSPVLTVSAIAKYTGLPLSTVSRMINDMAAHGLLQRDDQRRVRIGIRLWELGSRASPTLGLREAAMPFMNDLHSAVGHHVQLVVLRADTALVVERLSSPGAVPNISRIAGRLPLHLSSGGLVLLAHGPAELQESVLAGPLATYTRNTPVDPSRLRVLLSEIRRRDMAFCPGFVDGCTTGVSVPLRTTGRRVVAALTTIVPNDVNAWSVIPALVAAGRGISRCLGANTVDTDELNLSLSGSGVVDQIAPDRC